MTADYKKQQKDLDQWDDYCPDLWAKGNLKYLRDDALPFDQVDSVSDVKSDSLKCQEEYQKNDQEGQFVFCAKYNPKDSLSAQTTLDEQAVKVSSQRKLSTAVAKQPGKL